MSSSEALPPWNLNVGHLGALGLLYTRGSLSQQQLIDALEIDKSSMGYLVDEKERLTVQGRERFTDRRCCRTILNDLLTRIAG